MKPGKHELGPHNATLQVKTYREGVVSKAVHDLVIEVTGWHATVTSGAGSTPVGVNLSADPRSLRVRDAHGGAKPLTDRDRREIAENINRKVLGEQAIDFRSTGVERPAADARLRVIGELRMAGRIRPVSFEVGIGPDGHVEGTFRLRQSDWGIKPYTALMGGLRVGDHVDVVLDARLPSSG